MISYSFFKEPLRLLLFYLHVNPIHRKLLIESYDGYVLHIPISPIIKSIFYMEVV
jgi:hypothetical protein